MKDLLLNSEMERFCNGCVDFTSSELKKIDGYDQLDEKAKNLCLLFGSISVALKLLHIADDVLKDVISEKKRRKGL